MKPRFWLLAALALLGAAPAERREPFAVESPGDGLMLHGEIDWPAGRARAIVVMLPGSGTHTRDMPSSPRGAPRSFVFRDLSDRLLAEGIATVRYDERGIGCRGDAKPDDIGRCFDDVDARTINWTTLRDDALAIYRRGAAAANGRCVLILGHSEGVVHAARLIASGAAQPVGLVAVSSVFGPLDGVLRYQKVTMIPRALAAADADHDGVTSRSELAAALAHGPLSRYGAADRIPWPSGWRWPEGGVRRADLAALRTALAADYRAFVRETLSHRDADPFTTPLPGGGTSVVASYGWEKVFVRPSPPVVRDLANYRGAVAAFFGEEDGNIDVPTELRWFRRGAAGRAWRVEVTPGVGHVLGDNASFGPMRADRQAAVVAAVTRMVADCRR